MPASTAPPVPLARRIAESVHLTALGLWLGALVTAGITAAVIFPTMRDLDPALPAYAAYTGSHADLAAGFVQNKVFYAVDIVQFACATLALVSLLLMLTLGKLVIPRWSTAIRMVALGAALLITSYWLMMLAPQMQTDVRAYWSAAQAGDLETASTAKAAFDRSHPLASNLFKSTALAVAVALVAGAWSAVSIERDARPAS